MEAEITLHYKAQKLFTPTPVDISRQRAYTLNAGLVPLQVLQKNLMKKFTSIAEQAVVPVLVVLVALFAFSEIFIVPNL